MSLLMTSCQAWPRHNATRKMMALTTSAAFRAPPSLAARGTGNSRYVHNPRSITPNPYPTARQAPDNKACAVAERGTRPGVSEPRKNNEAITRALLHAGGKTIAARARRPDARRRGAEGIFIWFPGSFASAPAPVRAAHYTAATN
jgi:hypothetical protein